MTCSICSSNAQGKVNVRFISESSFLTINVFLTQLGPRSRFQSMARWPRFLDAAMSDDLKLIVEFISNVSWSFNPDEFDTDPSVLMSLKGTIRMSTRQLVRDFAFSQYNPLADQDIQRIWPDIGFLAMFLNKSHHRFIQITTWERSRRCTRYDFMILGCKVK